MRRLRAAPLLLGLVLPACVTAAAQEAPPAPAEQPPEAAPAESTRLLLDAIRDDLVGLRFEEALAALEALLGRPGLSEDERAEALVLRSQAHVAFGDLDAAEEDYREILRGRPGFRPDTSLTPTKAMERFDRARAALVGDLFVDVTPEDARLFVDGRRAEPPSEGGIPLLAGERVLRAEREGFDPREETVIIEASQDQRLELRLVPNARTVVLQTEPAGVDVTLDGIPVGRTARDPTESGWAAAREPARLTLENLPLGEHLFTLSKDCYRKETLRDLLTVDLLDWSPKVYPPVALVPVRSTVVLRGGPDGARVLVDDEPVARLPAAPFEVCPGERHIDVRLGERGVWSRDVALAESEEGVLEVEPRPNVVQVGADTWPEELVVFDGKFNRTVHDAGPPTGDLSRSETWDALAWPADADLVLAPRATRDGAPGWWLYSPVLRLVAPLDARTLEAIEARPRWTGVAWGFALVDSLRRGPALVARVTEGGPAAQAGLRPGDRLISLGGSQVADAARARQILAVATSRVPLDAEWLSPDGTARRGKIQGVETPLLDPGPRDPVAGMVRAAWARVDEACDPEAAPLAMANRALLLSTHGRHALAVRTWRRVVLPERAGIGRGTVQYHLGRDLQRTGAEEAAAQAHRAAAASEATALSDEGPRLAPAARDHLADLGVF